jgi:hypothetical protein
VGGETVEKNPLTQAVNQSTGNDFVGIATNGWVCVINRTSLGLIRLISIRVQFLLGSGCHRGQWDLLGWDK